MTKDEFDERLQRGPVEYHRGLLAKDRWPELSRVRAGDLNFNAIDVLARHAQHLMEKGNVLLVQKKYGPSDYGYIAVPTSRFRNRSTIGDDNAPF